MTTRRKLPILELLGILLLGIGFCGALASICAGVADETVIRDKEQVQRELADMKRDLIASKIPEDQIPGLLRIHKTALIHDSTQQHFLILSFMVLGSLIVASFGFCLMLWGRLRQSQALEKAQPSDGANAALGAPRSSS